ncbi:barstar family protein [Rhizobium leguminosarum]|uniref:Barstar (Barnase inhibitor) n=1 Tax=Rhizobium leguminosarum bv. trifolii (strain WSM1325) TaxID=395491 RepID=C6AUG9_RHILS|nr:barstar family protein [Rhizobium leguminosarum]ACS57539.1 Barstar (barnase inhibitor) [Rhizobium leguminosarum bv. trifolii WSM1325]MBY2909403.1 barstar family protein [Rhizobium leguminosarum]MBY2949633.1 barstar family protein [Rhizobium leguminosarum]MBY3029099.1 barstar family protein [Rhizobium leguminosarum]
MSATEAVVVMDGTRLVGHDKFHDSFAETFGFPDFYGRNMDAWIDCMSCLDDPDAGMSKLTIEPGKALTVRINNYLHFKDAAPQQWVDLMECAAFVNWRRTEKGRGAVLALAFYD